MNTSALSGVYLFKDFDQKELSSLAEIVSEKNTTAGEELFSAGQEATSFYLIQMGSIKIFSNTKSGDTAGITQMGTGSHFGELAFFDKGKRSATAQTVENSRLFEISYERLQKLLDSNPAMAVKFYKSCARFMASRLRTTTEDLTQVKEAKLRLF